MVKRLLEHHRKKRLVNDNSKTLSRVGEGKDFSVLRKTPALLDAGVV